MAEKRLRTAGQYAKAIVERLDARGETVTFAESCTGGLVAATLVGVPGASHVLKESYVTYCDEAKHKLLGVPEVLLEQYTAVSREVAESMALGVKACAGADYSISVTGYADGELENGGHHVFVACAFPNGETSEVVCWENWFPGDRNMVRRQAVLCAMKLLWRKVNEPL